MNFRKSVEDKILFILFTYRKEIIAQLHNETAFDIIRKHGLKWEDFSDVLNQHLYQSIQNQLYSGLSDVDFMSIIAYRPKQYRVFEQQANEYLGHIVNLTNTNYAAFSELDKLIYKLKEFNLQDFLRLKASQINSANFESTNVVEFGDSFVADYQQFYARLMSGVITKDSTLMSMGDELERKMQSVASGVTIGVPIHMASFQAKFGGWQAPDFIIIGGRPSMGKTAFILSVMWESAKYKNITFFTFEMSRSQIINKIAGNLTGIEFNDIERGRINPQQKAAVLAAYKHIEESKLNILDMRFVKLEALMLELRRLHRLGQLDMAVIDYLQLMKTDTKHTSREQEVSHISRELKLLCIELNIPICALAQLGRDCETRPNKRPILSDLRESGAIEQNADIVGFLYRDAYYFDKNISIPYDTEFKTEFIIGKGRNVGTGTLYFFNDVLNAKTIDLGY